MEVLPVSGSITSDHAHTWCAHTKPGRLHSSVQTRVCADCMQVSLSLEATYPQLHGSASKLTRCLKSLHAQLETNKVTLLSDPSCKVPITLCCGVPAFQSHSIATFFAYLAGLTGFYTFKSLIFLRSGEQTSFRNKVLPFFAPGF